MAYDESFYSSTYLDRDLTFSWTVSSDMPMFKTEVTPGEGEVTSLSEITVKFPDVLMLSLNNPAGVTLTRDGNRVSANAPLPTGLYIINGRKVLIVNER